MGLDKKTCLLLADMFRYGGLTLGVGSALHQMQDPTDTGAALGYCTGLILYGGARLIEYLNEPQNASCETSTPYQTTTGIEL